MAFDSAAFGRRIASARTWLGLTPQQVAFHLGLSPEAVNRWERGGLERRPDKGKIRLLAEILQQPEVWIIEGAEPPWTIDTVGDGARGGVRADEITSAVVAAFRTPEFREALRGALEATARADTAGRRRQLERGEQA